MDSTDTRRVFCHNCNKYTTTNPPIVFVRPGGQNFKISGVCDICQLAKTKFIQSGIKKYFHGILFFALVQIGHP